MVAYTYSRVAALNFNTTPPGVAKSATGSVYAVADTTFTTPLNMTMVVGGSVVTSISSDAQGFFPDFTVADRTSVVWKQASSSFTTVLTTSDPVPGPQGAAGTPGTPGVKGDRGDLATWVTNTFYPLNQVIANPDGDLVKVTTAHTSGASYDATKFGWVNNNAANLTGTLPEAAVPPRLTATELNAKYAPGGLAPTVAKPRKPLVSNMVTTFAAGHGWFNLSGAAVFTANDTTDYALGTQSVKIVTDTINTAAVMRSPALAVDATTKQFVIWVKVTGVANLTEMNLYAGDSTLANHYNWTIADAGGVAQHVFREGEWSPIVVGFADAFVVGSPSRSAITLMQFRIRASNGNSITVNVGGIGLTAELSTFPKGVISIACDDSYLSQFTQLKTALDKYGWGATAYTIVDRLGVSGFMTLDNLKELERTHGWEIAGHAYTMANHAIGYGNMTDAAVEADIKLLKTWLVDNNFIGADHMAYPLGSFTPSAQAVIGKYFATGRTVTNRLIETIRPSDRMRLRSLSMSNTTTLATAQALVDKVAAQKGWGIITFHDIVTTPTVGTQWSIADTFALIDYIATKDVVVMNVGDVVTRLGAPPATASTTDAVTGAVLHAAMGNATGKLNALPRAEAAAGITTVAGRTDLIAFTPAINMTITKLTAMTSGTAWTGHTLARMGLYTVDTAGAVTLVAQTASDTTLFIAAQTAYQRTLDTAGGYPASYALVAGQRYAVGVIGVGQTAGQLRGGTASSVLAARSPIMGGTLGTGLTDLPTTGTITATGNYPWAELAA